MKRSSTWLLPIHALFWSAIAALSYAKAGAYTLASCWHIILLYVPPLGLLLLSIAGVSLAAVLAALARPVLRGGAAFSIASHGLIATTGLFACNLAASAAAGQVNCL